MKKIFLYNFIPSKVEEEACRDNNTPWLVSRRLVETRDTCPPVIDLENPWQIKKVVIYNEAVAGKLVLPFAKTFENIFRYWTLDMAEYVTSGHKKNVDIWDIIQENDPKMYHNEGTFIEMMPNEIGLYWDPSWS